MDYHKASLQKQLAEIARLVGELKTVKVETKRREIVSELDVLTFAALGHLRGMDAPAR